MQTPKARTSSSETPQKVAPRATRQLKTTASDLDSASSSSKVCKTPKGRTPALELDTVSTSSQASRTPKGRSPKVVERRTPRSPASEKKNPNRELELDSKLAQLREDLQKVKGELVSAESLKQQAQQDAEESKRELLDLSLKLEETQKELQALSAIQVTELEKTYYKQDQTLHSELGTVQTQLYVDSPALVSAMNEIRLLKVELEAVAESEAAQAKLAELAQLETHRLEGNLAESLSLLGNMKSQLEDCKESEARAQAMVCETLLQLEAAKKTIEALNSDGVKAMESYNSIASELNQSKARVSLLEELVSKLNVDSVTAGCNCVGKPVDENKVSEEVDDIKEHSNQLEKEVDSMRFELEQLKSALENSEVRYHEEQTQGALKIRNAHELVEQIKSASSSREAELEAELKKAKADIEELKANLMDKETEVQGVLEENEGLNMRLENNFSVQQGNELERKLKEKIEHVADLRADLMDKETELQNILEENEMLRLDLKRREMDGRRACDEAALQVEEARAAEREALMKLGLVMEEAEKSSRRVARVTEQLEAVQSVNSEMETELRKLKVQSNQWRKAAEAAAAMLSNGKLMDRTGSLDDNYHDITGRMHSPCFDDIDDDSPKKKNGNVLKRIGVLWKKPPK